MRNDVKLGFAIGGVLLAVLIVYVLVVPGGSNIKQTKLDLNAKTSDGGKVTLEPVPAPQAAIPPAPAAVFTPGTTSLEPATQPSQVASNDTGDKVVDPAPPAKSKDIDWSKLLNGQALMTSTPEAAGGSHAMAKPVVSDAKVTPPLEPETKTTASVSPTGTNVDLTPDQTPMDQPDKAAVVAMANTQTMSGTFPQGTSAHNSFAAPSTRPAGSGAAIAGRTHVVQSGETLSSISAAAYGSANYWPAIVKANPNLDPNRMRAGATVILPDLKDVKPGEPQTASGKVAGTSSAAAINPQKQYRVVSGDSMYKISVKLYGNASMAGKIFDTNKQLIGDDPAKLKVNEVLQLPEPPTVATVR